MEPDVQLHARAVAQDLMLRAIVTQWAKNSPDPEQFVRAFIESIIGSMDTVEKRPAANSEARQLWDAVETDLRDFMGQAILRLTGKHPED